MGGKGDRLRVVVREHRNQYTSAQRLGDLVGEHAREADSGDCRVDGSLGRVDREA